MSAPRIGDTTRTDFDPVREAAFKVDYASRSLASVRFGLGLGVSLFALFAPLDIWMLPESWRVAHLIRFGIVIPVGLAAIASTFTARGKLSLQYVASAFVVFAGLGIVGMIAVAQESEPAFRYYYAGLLLVLPYSVTVVRLRFRPTAVCSLIIIAAYELVAIVVQRLLSEGLLSGMGPVFLNNNFFLIAAGVIALIGSFTLESYARKDFYQRNELADTLDALKATQTQLIQSERTSAMGCVVAGLLHELNTPVGAIVSAADVVNRGSQKLNELKASETERRSKTIALIDSSASVLQDASERVRHTLDVLKRFTHLDRAETGEYDVNNGLDDCLTMLAHEIGDRIVVVRKFGALPTIRCRPSEINQLLMCVLKNAIESIADTGKIELETSAQDEFVRIDVADSGAGIEEERLKDLFVPRFRQDHARVKLGFGLITSHNVVQGHGGSIHIESTVGQGTHVSLTLPEKSAAPERELSVS